MKYALLAGPPLHTVPGKSGPLCYVFDTETDSLIDSIFNCNATYFNASLESGYIAAGCGMDYNILDATTHAVLGTAKIPSEELFLDESHGVVVGVEWPALNEVVIDVAALPTGEILYSDTVFSLTDMIEGDIRRVYLSDIDAKSGLVFGQIQYGRDHDIGQDILAYDYLNHTVHDIYRVRPDADTNWAKTILRLDVHPDGRRVYFVSAVEGWDTWRLICYDMESRAVVFTCPAHSYLEYVQVTPDGSRVFLTTPGGFCVPPYYEYIAVYDADHGSLIAEIPLDTLNNGYELFHVFPKQIRFVPNSNIGYLAEGEAVCGSGPGRVVVIDTDHLRIARILPQHYGFINTNFLIETVPLRE